jgi:hypothetical protein
MFVVYIGERMNDIHDEIEDNFICDNNMWDI